MTIGAIALQMAAMAAAGAVQQTPSQPDPITVTGQRESVSERVVEEPYPEVERVLLGSRIPRRAERRPFRTVATDTGLAGLLSAPGNNMDAAGGVLPNTRNRLVRECVADREEVSEATACVLYRAGRLMREGDNAGAAAVLQPLMESRTLSSFDRYYTAHFAYRLAQAVEDERGRERALAAMLGSGRMPEAERPAALRTLVSLALKRGDDAAAIASLERLVASIPDDAGSLANLAGLYARAGRHDLALPRMASAVRLIEQAGGRPPPGWMQYLDRQPQ